MPNIHHQHYHGLSGYVHRANYEMNNFIEKASKENTSSGYIVGIGKKLGQNYVDFNRENITPLVSKPIFGFIPAESRALPAIQVGFSWISHNYYHSTVSQTFSPLLFLTVPYKSIISSPFFPINGALLAVQIGLIFAVGNGAPCPNDDASQKTHALLQRGILGKMEDLAWSQADLLSKKGASYAAMACRLAASTLCITAEIFRVPTVIGIMACNVGTAIGLAVVCTTIEVAWTTVGQFGNALAACVRSGHMLGIATNPSSNHDMDKIPGLEAMKTYVDQSIQTHQINEHRRKHNKPIQNLNKHIYLTGDSGTGKTMVARKLASILKSKGILSKGHLVEVARSDLVGRYIGSTEVKTAAVCKRALGGVLFIDEAYTLCQTNDSSEKEFSDFGRIALEEILKFMEDHRDNLIVIVAGYPAEMDKLLRMNPGLTSRFSNKISLPSYNDTELAQIANMMIEDQGFNPMPPGTLRDIIRDCIPPRSHPDFANARSVRNTIDAAIRRQSARLARLPESEITAKTLSQLFIEDFTPWERPRDFRTSGRR